MIPTYYKTTKGTKREFYDDEKLILNSDYKYQVVAVFENGRKSPRSEPITVHY